MDVGILQVFASYGWSDVTDSQVYDEEIRLALLAEELGFDVVWQVEHHFFDYAFCPDLKPARVELVPGLRPIFWMRELPDPGHLHSILCRLEPWYELDTGRLEIVNRLRFWRFLLGDDRFDADYWLTRLENAP